MSEYTPSFARVRDVFSWAYAWRTRDNVDEGETDLSGLRESNRAEFDRAMQAHDREVAAKALRDAADRYNAETDPESDSWNPLTAGSDDFEGILLRYAALVSEPSTPAPVEPERPPCTDFHWVGQAFSSCDMCGKPFWDHVTHRGEPISDEFRAGVKRKWEVVEPVPESTTDTKGTP